jgi:hypothetical protein
MACYELIPDELGFPALFWGNFGKSTSPGMNWLPPRDSNPDSLLQRQVS